MYIHPCFYMSFKLPAFFDSKVKKPEPTSKEGRIRSKEHVHGNWPTIIFIPSKRRGGLIDLNVLFLL